jgi:hypothetical protein
MDYVKVLRNVQVATLWSCNSVDDNLLSPCSYQSYASTPPHDINVAAVAYIRVSAASLMTHF